MRQVKAAVQEFGGVEKVPITKEMVKSVQHAHASYVQEQKKEKEEDMQMKRKKEAAEERKRKAEEAKLQQKTISNKLDKLNADEKKAQEDMDKAMAYIEQGGQRISEGVKQSDMMEVEAGNGLIDFGRKKQAEQKKKLCDIAEERKRLESELLGFSTKKKKT